MKEYDWIKERRNNPAGSGIKDRLGREICHGDVVRFVDKFEWYRSTHSATDIPALPYEERKVVLPEDYPWLLMSEIQTYWQVMKHRGKPVPKADDKRLEERRNARGM